MNSLIYFFGPVDCLVTVTFVRMEELVGLFALPWSDRKEVVLGSLFRLA